MRCPFRRGEWSWVEYSRRVRESLGLPCTVIEERRLWYWKVNISGERGIKAINWEIPREKVIERFPHQTAYTIFLDRDDNVLGYVDWEYLITHDKIERISQTFEVLIFPWEDQDLFRPKNTEPPQYMLYLDEDVFDDKSFWDESSALHESLSRFVNDPWGETAPLGITTYIILCLALHGAEEKKKEVRSLLDDLKTRVMDAQWMQYQRTVVFESDEQCVLFLKSNDITNPDMLCRPTARDIHHHMALHGLTLATLHPEDVPQVVFSLPFESFDISNTFDKTNISNTFGKTNNILECPVYENGMIHLSRREMGRWCWDAQTRVFDVTIPRFVYAHREHLLESLQHLVDELTKNIVSRAPIKRPKHNNYNSNYNGNWNGNYNNNNSNNNNVLDIEDLVSRCPGCVKQLVDPPRHYKDAERTALTSQLRRGRFERDSDVVRRVFADTAPHWNYVTYWDAGYAAEPCSVFIENALSHRSATMYCPHAKPDLSVPQTTAICHSLFTSQYPNKTHHTDILESPFNWFLWMNRQGSGDK